ncbi:methyl-accepting chemotaxis protein [Undibacterium sp. Di27W]|uniref:methyl-accepting chemotaxis protein n=1 Tax=Undibacterium sp. Di27W TaxID=3413036 RepID=UPI003BF42E15
MKTTLKTRLMLVMGIMSALMILLGMTGLYALGTSHAAVKASHEEGTLSLEKLASLEKLLMDNRYAILSTLADPTPQKLKASAEEIEHDKRAIEQLWIDFATAPMSSQARKTADELTHLRVSFDHAVTLPLVQAMQVADAAKIKNISNAADKLYPALFKTLSNLRSMHMDDIKKGFAGSEAEYATSGKLIWAVMGLGLVLAATLAYFMLHNIYQQLGGEPAYAAQIARQIADGDLDVSISPEVPDEGSLLASLQRLQTGLAKTVKDMHLNTSNIARTSGQILNNNAVLSARIEQQAGSQKRAATAINELATMIRHNAEQARHAMQCADDVSELAFKKGQAAGGAVIAMTQIQQASARIFDNIHVIDELVFQIDTLSLKATLENDSAAEAGQGFTAIAPEVRDLAQCVACAVKEIKNLLNESQEKLDHGSKLFSQSNAGTEKILTALQQVTSLMTEVNTSTKKQEASIRQAKHAIIDMEYASHKDAVQLSVAITAARLLEQQAKHLVILSSGFKLGPLHRPQAQLQVISTVSEAAPAKRPSLRLVHP